MQLQESEDEHTALVVGCEDKAKARNEGYLGIAFPQLSDKGVKGWCINWIKGKVIPVFAGAMEKR